MRVAAGILAVMFRRSGLAWLIALAVASAPIALEVCRIACESTHARQSAAHATAHQPPCHESGGTSPQVSAHSRACDHSEETATAGITVARPSDTVVLLAVAVPTSAGAPPASATPRERLEPAFLPDRGEVRLTTLLRI